MTPADEEASNAAPERLPRVSADPQRSNVRVLALPSLEAVRAEMRRIGAHRRGVELMAPKALFFTINVEKLPVPAANIVKQEMLAKGGDASVSTGATVATYGTTDALLTGTFAQFQRVTATLREQPMGLRRLAQQLDDAISAYSGAWHTTLRIGPRDFTWGARTFVMGIVNATSDSFSGDGLAGDVDRAVAQAERMVADGADIIDVGGESTRPGAALVSAEQEAARVLPVVERLVARLSVPVSVDTYKAAVARRCLESGAHLINDVWGLAADPDMAAVVAEFGVPVIIMHNRRTPIDAAVVQTPGVGGHYRGVRYDDLMGDLIRDLRGSLALAAQAGITTEKIIVDPGIGFGKAKAQNFTVLRELAQLKVLGRPILVGTSRKSFLGLELDLPPDQRVEGTAASVALAIANGADIVRVHDVKEMVRVCRVADATVRLTLEDDDR